MKLTRLRIEQLRQFRAPFEIRDFAPGLNLFSGPNEAGKSTLVAAIRAAFFERHRSGAVDDLRPWGDSAAAPTVELDFELGGQPCRLVKSFLARKRCELRIGTQGLDGAEAEDRLAELLGFQHAGKGASKAEHWGIPGLLWIQQGAAQELREAVGHATDHLRSALEASLGEVAASGGDDLLASVQAQRSELLTEAGGRPRGPYKDALEREAALAATLGGLDAAIAHYRQRVDALASLRRAHAADELEQPWVDCRRRQHEAAERLQAIQAQQDSLAAEGQRAEAAERRAALLRSQLEAWAREDQALAARAAAQAEALAARDATAAPLAHWQARQEGAARELDAARAALRQARQQHARAQLARDAAAAAARAQACARQLAEAAGAREALLAVQRAAAASAIPAAELKALRTLERQLAEVHIQRDAAATRLAWVLQADCALRLGEATLSGSGEIRLTAPASLELPGLGRLEIAPGGGSDLATLDARGDELADRRRTLLARLGLPDLAAAEARELEHSRLQQQLAAAQATLQALAPQGVDALGAEHAALQARADELARALADAGGEGAGDGGDKVSAAGPAPTAGDTPPLSVDQAEAAEQAAAHTLAAIQGERHRAQLAAADAASRLDAATRELAAARALCADPARAARIAQSSAELTDALAERKALGARIEALQQHIAAARPDILQQDVERFRATAEELETQHRVRRDQLMRLEVELQTEGAQGLEERRAECARDHAQAARRAGELRRRAAALDLLLGLLQDKRRALTRRLQAPLQKHLNRYLQLLFPQASLEIDENLTPGPLTRGVESGDFEQLSFGAREQMGVISRLAYADLLAEAGRPTLIILDDALVHSDAERLAQMKRVLFDAATRHQILLFTCHPANWRDLGVAARSIDDLRAGSAQ